MKVLFLSIKVASANARDAVTYNFIMKEMRALVASGVSVYFYSDAFEQPEYIEGIRCFGRASGTFERLRVVAFILWRLRFFVPRLRRDWRSALWIAATECSVRAMVLKEGIDIVHTHFLWPEGECCELLVRELGIPIIATLRGAELYDEPDLDYGSMRDANFRANFASAKEYICHFTAPNRGLLQKLCDEYGIPRSRCSLVFNGVESFDITLPLRQPANPPLLVAVGQFVNRKNYEWLIRQLSALRNGPEFRLLIYGFGIERANLEAAIAESGLKCIELCDVRPKTEIVRIMRDADALIHPSRIEGLPNVVLESLAVGTPVIVSDIDAHRDIVHHGYNGFLFELGSSSALVDTLSALLQQPTKLASLSPNCIESVRDFSLDAKIAKYLQIYESALTPVKE